jgi:site-specific recombinase XerD
MCKKSVSFRVGKVRAYLRGRAWYLCYHEDGHRHRPRVGPYRQAARQLAAQVNAQLEVGAPAALSFEPIPFPTLRHRWLEHHEQVLRSSVQTINRYRTATDHLLRFLETRPMRYASRFHASRAEEFVRYLRALRVSPNGHAHTAKRPLLDKGLRYVLECCRALFNYAARRRHLSPYAENPFRTLQIDRIPVQATRAIELFTAEQERAFLEACDDWQFPLFLTLLLTGLRPGELTHLLLPNDLDLSGELLRVRNKPQLGWQVKTRNERDIPLMPVLAEVHRVHLRGRAQGPVFQRRRWAERVANGRAAVDQAALGEELLRRIAEHEVVQGRPLTRAERGCVARGLWRDLGAVKPERVRLEFMRLTRAIGLPGCTAPKALRHLFATALQEGRVDPLIRNELMGHVAAGERSAGHGLAMTAVYTHTRPEAHRQQLEAALSRRPAIAVAEAWLRHRGGFPDLDLRTFCVIIGEKRGLPFPAGLSPPGARWVPLPRETNQHPVWFWPAAGHAPKLLLEGPRTVRGRLCVSARPPPARGGRAPSEAISMSALSFVHRPQGSARPHAEFQQLYPVIERHAQVVFRGRSPADPEEAVAGPLGHAGETLGAWVWPGPRRVIAAGKTGIGVTKHRVYIWDLADGHPMPRLDGTRRRLLWDSAPGSAWIDSKQSQALAGRGFAKLRRNDLDGASEDFNRALESDAKHAAAHRGLGRVALGHKDFARAVAAFEKAVQGKPNDLDFRYDLARAHALWAGSLPKDKPEDLVRKEHIRLAVDTLEKRWPRKGSRTAIASKLRRTSTCCGTTNASRRSWTKPPSLRSEMLLLVHPGKKQES